MLDADDIVLAVVEGCDGTVEGRTKLQKLAYFVTEVMSLDSDYAPHYYGPYSYGTAAATEGQTARGLLTERVEPVPWPAFAGHDLVQRRYTYEITLKGQEASKFRKQANAQDFQKATELVRAVRGVTEDYRVLSWAAKVYWVVKTSGEPVTPEQIRRHSSGLGWALTPQQVEQASNVLLKLGLVVKATKTSRD